MGAAQTLEDVEFTHRWYREFLEHLLAEGFEFRAYADDLGAGDALLRHDVDLSVEAAVETARIEADLGVHATYFFLVATPMYNPLYDETRARIREIADLGHDVGLHFSTHQYWGPGADPDDAAVAERVRAELDVFSAVADPVDAVSFHLPPDWVLRRTFDDFDSTYEPRFFSDIGYCADSTQRWRDDPPLRDGVPEKLQVLTHPGLWGEADRTFDECVLDAATDAGRRVDDYARTRYLEEMPR